MKLYNYKKELIGEYPIKDKAVLRLKEICRDNFGLDEVFSIDDIIDIVYDQKSEDPLFWKNIEEYLLSNTDVDYISFI